MKKSLIFFFFITQVHMIALGNSVVKKIKKVQYNQGVKRNREEKKNLFNSHD